MEPVDDSENRTRGKTGAEYSALKRLKFAAARPTHAQPPDQAKSGEGVQASSRWNKWYVRHRVYLSFFHHPPCG